MTSEALKPCPFCGGEAEVSPHEVFGSAVTCLTEGCAANIDLAASDAEAIAAWNKRASHAQLVAALREINELAALPDLSGIEAFKILAIARAALATAEGEQT